jgi:hypothetical protein
VSAGSAAIFDGSGSPQRSASQKISSSQGESLSFFGGFQLTDAVFFHFVDGIQKRNVIVCRQQLLRRGFVFGFNREPSG